jgi:DNA-binding MarR family transcriptional regulator
MASERDLVSGLVQLANLLTRRMAPLFEKAKITPQQWAIIASLSGGGSMSLAALARRLNVSKQNMTGMIGRLEQLGLVEREGDPNDLRSSRVGLTRRGRALADKLRPAYDDWVARLAGDRDAAQLTRTVDRLIETLSREE